MNRRRARRPVCATTATRAHGHTLIRPAALTSAPRVPEYPPGPGPHCTHQHHCDEGIGLAEEDRHFERPEIRSAAGADHQKCWAMPADGRARLAGQKRDDRHPDEHEVRNCPDPEGVMDVGRDQRAEDDRHGRRVHELGDAVGQTAVGDPRRGAVVDGEIGSKPRVQDIAVLRDDQRDRRDGRPYPREHPRSAPFVRSSDAVHRRRFGRRLECTLEQEP